LIRPRVALIFVLALGCFPAWGEYQPKGKRDPFSPLILPDGRRMTPPGVEEESGASGPGSAVLQGILFDPAGDSAAVLNGHVLREKEEWEGIKLLKIEADSVTISKNGETQQLVLEQPETEKEKKTE